ncbi:MAG: hypothetical protein WBA10_00085 [Elainellaceae cyanobacterium]
MNAAEQAKSVDAASKIAAVVTHFKAEFPDARSDLKPWANDQETRSLVDPDSIDIGFHMPGYSRRLQGRSLLVQIRFYSDESSTSLFEPDSDRRRAIGLEIAGFDHRGKQWQLSTVDQWQVLGNSAPVPELQEKLKRFCRQALALFNGQSGAEQFDTGQPDAGQHEDDTPNG